MINKVKAFIEKYNMIEQESHIIVGVSGGADSMCLLLVLLELTKAPERLHVVHINHGLREAAKGEADYVNSFCESVGVSCHIYEYDVANIALEKKLSTEEAGRLARYQAFEAEASKYENSKIAVAHNISDNAETVLFNMLRGASINGISGIKPVNGKIIRPLLCVDRNEIEGYLDRKGIAFVTDESNNSDDYTRNVIRHKIIPVAVNEINNAAVNNIFELSEDVSSVRDYLLYKEEDDFKKVAEVGAKQVNINANRFEELHPYMKRQIIYRALTTVAGRMKDIERKHVDMVQMLFENQVGRQVSLPYDMIAVRDYNGITIKKRIITVFDDSEVKLVDDCVFGNYRYNIRIFDKTNLKEYPKEKYTKWFDYDKIKNIPVIRHRKEGDFICLTSDGKTQKLKKYFINEKIPSEERQEIALICDGQAVMWVVGYRMSSEYMISENTKRIIEISVK